MKKIDFLAIALLGVALFYSCEPVDGPWNDEKNPKAQVSLENVARLFATLPIKSAQVGEVFDAVSGSSDNGYDEEYTMQDLFLEPGSGVGSHSTATRALFVPTKSSEYEKPLRELLREAVVELPTKADITIGGARDILGTLKPQEFLDVLEDSDIQIYWPYSEDWDWETLPIITYDPENGAEVNNGFELLPDGSVREIEVSEELARQRPVWVVNRNDDSDHTSLELLRKQGGGEITVTPTNAPRTKAEGSQALILKDFTMRVQGDSWFCGASEYFVKIGAVEDFVASTEEELKLFNPTITDFMIVVRRKEINIPRSVNTVLVSNWTPQLENCAFMIIEDDGGTQTKWACSAIVKYNSKSYGFDISIPINSRDDIIWRGQLSRKFLESTSGKRRSFGDVDLTFDLEEY